MNVNGIVVVDKSAGMTSHDVVHATRKLFQTKRVGHTGTLDPDATGVLVLCLGQATRLAEYLSAARKHYTAEVVFGIETDTLDASGAIVSETDASHISEAAIRSLLPRFQGKISQVPPMMSALHHEGQRLYELARAGITVERAAREVEIDTLELTAFTPGAHSVTTLEITCSTGTYIRTLAADLGTAAGVGGMMRSLRRTWVGENEQSAFSLHVAHTLVELRQRAQDHTLVEIVLPAQQALAAWPQVRLTDALLERIRHGRWLQLAEISEVQRANWHTVSADKPVVLLDGRGEVAAVARLQAGKLQPIKVLQI